MQHEAQKFTGIVKKLSRTTFINNIYDSDDIEQELWLKLHRVLPRLKVEKEEEIYPLVKHILKNHITDIIRKQVRRPDTSVYSKRESIEIYSSEETDDKLDNAPCALGKLRKISAFDIAEYCDLKKLIAKWGSNQDETAKRFITELIEPSPHIEKIWEDKKEKIERYRAFETIPWNTLGSLLGLSSRKRYSIINSLGKFLQSHGYDMSTWWKNGIPQ